VTHVIEGDLAADVDPGRQGEQTDRRRSEIYRGERCATGE
jgi:hypothetical protein